MTKDIPLSYEWNERKTILHIWSKHRQIGWIIKKSVEWKYYPQTQWPLTSRNLLEIWSVVFNLNEKGEVDISDRLKSRSWPQ